MIKNVISAFFLLLIAGLAACNLPVQQNLTVGADATQVVETLQAIRLTQTALTAATTPAPIFTPRPVVTFTPGSVVSVPTPVPPAATRPADAPPCDRAASGKPLDISIPDDTVLQPGQSFSKTWRLVNVGECAWSREYAVVWFSGEVLGGTRQQYLNSAVKPGQSVDITVDMVAPQAPGLHQSNWKLRNAEGKLFGIGPAGDAPFWVRIYVASANTATPTATPVGTATPVVQASGLLGLLPGQAVDLDSGSVGTGANDDLRFESNEEGTLELLFLDNAGLAMVNSQSPSLADCEQLSTDSQQVLLQAGMEGTTFCYTTAQGQIGYARVVLISLDPGAVNLRFVTWAAR